MYLAYGLGTLLIPACALLAWRRRRALRDMTEYEFRLACALIVGAIAVGLGLIGPAL
jgi:hypothetical protein